MSDEPCPECGEDAHDGECYSHDAWFLALSYERQERFISESLVDAALATRASEPAL